MKAIEFIESKRQILNEKEEFWTNEDLFYALQEAYTSVQKDIPYFKKIENLQTKIDVWKYQLAKKIIQPIKLKIENREYTVVSEKKFFSMFNDENYICSSYQHKLLISYPAFKEGLKIDIRYFYLDELESQECDIKLPEHYMEALHANFFSKVWEKNPKRGSRTLVNEYKRDYEIERTKLERYGMVKGQKMKSKYIKV